MTDDEAREALQRAFGDWATAEEVKEFLMDADQFMQASIVDLRNYAYIEYGPAGEIMYQGSISPVWYGLLFNHDDTAAEDVGVGFQRPSFVQSAWPTPGITYTADPDCPTCEGSGVSPNSPSPRYDDALCLTPCDCLWSNRETY